MSPDLGLRSRSRLLPVGTSYSAHEYETSSPRTLESRCTRTTSPPSPLMVASMASKALEIGETSMLGPVPAHPEAQKRMAAAYIEVCRRPPDAFDSPGQV